MVNRKDWLLLALAHQPERPLTPIQVQKAMFLMREEAGRKVGSGFYKFVPHNYGPFCAEIYRDLDALAKEGLVAIDPSPDRRWRSYGLTAVGQNKTLSIRRNADKDAARYLGKVVDWVTSLSFPDLVRAIYSNYPAYKKNSIFVD